MGGLLILIVVLALVSAVLLAVAWWKWARSSPRSRALFASQIFATLSLASVPALFAINPFRSYGRPYDYYGNLVVPLWFGVLALLFAIRGRGPSRRLVGFAAPSWMVFWSFWLSLLNALRGFRL